MELNRRKIIFSEWRTILILLIVSIAAFGTMLPKLGFYWDDWAKILVGRLFGLSGYWPYYAEDRPLSGWTHILLTPLLGLKPIFWHIFTLLMRWLTSIGIWLMIWRLWPNRRRLAFLSGLIFLVYPVFTQQAIAVTFHQQWLQYAVFVFSVVAMLKSFQLPRWSWPFTLLALAGMAIELTVTEYFVGLECLRFVLMGIVVNRDGTSFRTSTTKLLKLAWPYLLVLGGYVVWRLFFIQLTGEDPYRASFLLDFFSNPFDILRELLHIVPTDFFQVLIGSWGPVVGLGLERSDSLMIKVFSWVVGILSGLVVFGYLIRNIDGQSDSQDLSKKEQIECIIVGVAAVGLGCLPGWVTNRPVIFDFHSNRYAMPAMLGSALLWAGGLEWLTQRRLQRSLLISVLVGVASIFHINTANDYAKIWQNQLDFYWQLHWRAPYIEQGTAILGENELFPNQGSFSTSAALNLLYPQDPSRENLAYWYYNLQPRFAIEPSENPIGIPLRTQFRTLTYEGKTGESLVIFYDPGRAGCLWVLHKEDAINPDLPDLTREMLPASDLARIRAERASNDYPDERMFGKEPSHDWCYYYQKAALAIQQEDWKMAADLGDEAQNDPNNYPQNPDLKTPHEWIPFIRGYALTNRWVDAQEISIQAANVYQARYREEFCSLWDDLLEITSESAERIAATQEVRMALNCPR